MNNVRIFALPGIREARTEVIRKTIHFLIALSPMMAAFNKNITIVLLGTGVLLYSLFEVMRLAGIRVPLISKLTYAASRPRDNGQFVMGPVTLGMGAMLSFIFFQPVVAAVAVYALAFGDGFASLIGRLFGRMRPGFLYGKSVEGSLACFAAVYFSAVCVLGNPLIALAAALAASVTEALPLKDYDNIALPLMVGMTVIILL